MEQATSPGFFRRIGRTLVGRGNSGQSYSDGMPSPEVGDRFEQVASGTPVWIVHSVVAVKSSRIPLVHLTSEKYPHMMKIVSLPALADAHEFNRAH
jgi:hypothetical protein